MDATPFSSPVYGGGAERQRSRGGPRTSVHSKNILTRGTDPIAVEAERHAARQRCGRDRAGRHVLRIQHDDVAAVLRGAIGDGHESLATGYSMQQQSGSRSFAFDPDGSGRSRSFQVEVQRIYCRWNLPDFEGSSTSVYC